MSLLSLLCSFVLAWLVFISMCEINLIFQTTYCVCQMYAHTHMINYSSHFSVSSSFWDTSHGLFAQLTANNLVCPAHLLTDNLISNSQLPWAITLQPGIDMSLCSQNGCIHSVASFSFCWNNCLTDLCLREVLIQIYESFIHFGGWDLRCCLIVSYYTNRDRCLNNQLSFSRIFDSQ